MKKLKKYELFFAKCVQPVIRIFPNDESALRLIGALLAEKNEEWAARRYLDMGDYIEWKQNRTESTNQKVVFMGT